MKNGTINRFVGGVSLLVATGASLVLAGTSVGLFEALPGCGAGSGCDEVTNGPWGSIPVVGWPVSFVGLAWFCSMFVQLLRGVSVDKLIWFIRLGAIASLGFGLIMLMSGSFCKWCFLVHVCNWVFWVASEASTNFVGVGGVEKKEGGLGQFAVVFIVVSIALWTAEYAVGEREKVLVDENIEEVVGGTDDQQTLLLLRARHRIGPSDAPVQIVLFTDYQCPDCKRYELQLSNIVRARNDVSVSIKHFPLCSDCNGNIGSLNMHPNACWAARVSETAAMLGDQEQWEQVHRWLFSQGGSFTDQSLPGVLVSFGFNAAEFINVMKGSDTETLVGADADDGFALGVYFTPMIFINGVEYLWYYGNEDSLSRVVASVANEVAANSATTTPPPDTRGKYIEDWRRGKRHGNMMFDHASWRGGGDIEIVVWGDYQSTQTVELDRAVRAFMKENTNTKYAFRNFPIDEACNTLVKNFPTNYDGSCFIAKAVESVGVLAGNEARWAFHDWVVESPLKGNQGVVLAKASELSGTEQSVVRDVMTSIEVGQRLRNDVFSKNGVWQRGVPVLLVDGRFVPRWRSDNFPASELFQRISDVIECERTNR